MRSALRRRKGQVLRLRNGEVSSILRHEANMLVDKQHTRTSSSGLAFARPVCRHFLSVGHQDASSKHGKNGHQSSKGEGVRGHCIFKTCGSVTRHLVCKFARRITRRCHQLSRGA